MTSAYPIPVDTLTDKVRALAVELGELPSRNRVIKTFNVGAPKATAALDALKAAGFTPVTPDDATPAEAPTRRLHAVAPEPAPTPEPEENDAPADEVVSVEVTAPVDPEPSQASAIVYSGPEQVTETAKPVKAKSGRAHSWALLVIALGAFVAIWGGWVGLGKLTGFGEIALLPGIADGFTIDSAITLPLGVEAYAAFALRVWLSSGTRSAKAKRFAKWSTIGALALGAAGQVAYHLMTSAGITVAPWQITTFVSCLPVVVLGCAAALTHLLHDNNTAEEAQQ
jgi:hypothetical protein